MRVKCLAQEHNDPGQDQIQSFLSHLKPSMKDNSWFKQLITMCFPMQYVSFVAKELTREI